jgi:hypothetical protein
MSIKMYIDVEMAKEDEEQRKKISMFLCTPQR